ncbi:MAG: hypothetical protein EAZ19_24180 [Oscillatoriales cyanobacterium]|nr:MAG: hypothetical protein EAZ86_11755 [Oscillatoriales cyanobacterium]TAF90906.1 MAG: hypothetical protein EAZ49_07240 [Oscillatoriales cyanobacterium]TAG64751.1 MAG: hypothetical protein EAZ25_18770 [Oscillatoriales cyanobacterium]TAG74335.1 MAG: hypothetical protein EAZ23_06780 [Oscillatoriales cyanobacterium]TAG89372.1 MAG: hypothetical protein EAZ19_24180 [Oscillatoriales cyanobacterium]
MWSRPESPLQICSSKQLIVRCLAWKIISLSSPNSHLTHPTINNDYQLSTTNCQLPTVNCQLPTANCQLPTANYQLPTVY